MGVFSESPVLCVISCQYISVYEVHLYLSLSEFMFWDSDIIMTYIFITTLITIASKSIEDIFYRVID